MTEKVRKPRSPRHIDGLVYPVGRRMAVLQLPVWMARSSTGGVCVCRGTCRAECGAETEGPGEQVRMANTRVRERPGRKLGFHCRQFSSGVTILTINL